MSIRDRIIALEGSELWRFEPRGYRVKRRLYLTSAAMKDLTDAGSAINVLHLRGFVQSALVHWVTGGRVRADTKGRARFLKRLCPPPPEIWEVRVTDPVPQVRLLGCVVEPDTLVLTKFHTRRYLGDKRSPNSGWREALPACAAALAALFPGEPLFQRNSIKDYVTENCDDYPITC